jgi:rSAM/selenodomain-associated transferase 2
MTIGVVVPALNEAHALERTLRSLLSQARPPDRLVVVDGESTDQTVAVARSLGVEVMVVPGRGRGGQIAAGVASSPADVIVIAHADMSFPPDALGTIEAFLAHYPACPGGCLGHRFDQARWVYRAIEWWDRRRAIRGYSYGDQAQFFWHAAIEQAGGFPEQPLMEDVELSRRLRILGRTAYLDRPVTVSARRYERLGWLRVMWANWRLRRVYRREGEAACWRLYRDYYGRVISRSGRP